MAGTFLSHRINDPACIAELTEKCSVDRKGRNPYVNFTSGENILPCSTFYLEYRIKIVPLTHFRLYVTPVNVPSHFITVQGSLGRR